MQSIGGSAKSVNAILSYFGRQTMLMITVICLNSVSGQMLLPSLLPDIVAVFSHPGLLLGVSVKNLSSNPSKCS